MIILKEVRSERRSERSKN